MQTVTVPSIELTSQVYEVAVPDQATPKIESIKLFMSFDIVGSTYHKQKYKNNWQHDFEKFQQRINDDIELFNKEINTTEHSRKYDIRIWKRLGDEVIYETDIIKAKYLLKAVNLAFKILHSTASFLEAKGSHLSLKGTVWVCPIDGVNNVRLEGKNDYIGKHIDEGFRVSANFAKRRQLAISYELAYLLSHFNDEDSFTPFYFMGYRHLKGVWSSKFYPVIWYSNRIEDSLNYLPYDECEKCDITKLFNADCKRSGKQIKALLKAVEAEVEDLNRIAADMLEFLGGNPDVQDPRQEAGQDVETVSEIIFALFCFKDQDRKSLLVSKNGNALIVPSSKVSIHQNIIEAGLEKFKSEFNVSTVSQLKLLQSYVSSDVEGKGWNIIGIVAELPDTAEKEAVNQLAVNDHIFEWVSIEDITALETSDSSTFAIQEQVSIYIKTEDLL